MVNGQQKKKKITNTLKKKRGKLKDKTNDLSEFSEYRDPEYTTLYIKFF